MIELIAVTRTVFTARFSEVISSSLSATKSDFDFRTKNIKITHFIYEADTSIIEWPQSLKG